ncbi:MAG: hypothetical protein K8R77_12060, partial [Anaerolineaceae bacterium]|nr:hypothetical protein [Anaerolineaceae bacterium]
TGCAAIAGNSQYDENIAVVGSTSVVRCQKLTIIIVTTKPNQGWNKPVVGSTSVVKRLKL